MSNLKKTNTFRFPFDINPKVFIALAIFFFILSIKPITNLFLEKNTPKSVGKKLEKEINKKVKLFDVFMLDSFLLKKPFEEKLTDNENIKLTKLPFNFQLFQHDTLVFWNTNLVDNIVDTFAENTPTLFENKNGYFVLYKKYLNKTKTQKALLIIPIKRQTMFNGTYMKSYFYIINSYYNDNIGVSKNIVNNGIPVKFQQKPIMYLYSVDDYLQNYNTNISQLIFSTFLFIFFGISIHTYFKVVVKKKNPILIFSLLVFTTVLIRISTYLFSFPNDFAEFDLFNPEHYAGGYINKSLGDLFINVCLLFWISLFFLVNIQGKIFIVHSEIKKFLLGIIVLFVMVSINYFYIYLVYSLILDSTIIFDTTLVSKLNIHSIVGLLCILVIFGNMFVVGLIGSVYANKYFLYKYLKYIFIAVSIFFIVKFFPLEHPINNGSFLAWSISVFILLDFTSYKIRFDFNSIYLLIWIILISFFGALFITKLNYDKEQSLRKEFAENILKDKDEQAENKLSILRNKIQTDTNLKNIFIYNQHNNNNNVYDYIYKNLFDPYLNNYKYDEKIFDKNGNSINDFDTLNAAYYTDIIYKNERTAIDTNIFVQMKNDEYAYYTIIHIENKNEKLGTIILTLSSSLNIFEENNTDNLIYGGIRNMFKENKYSIAIYNDSNLITRKGFYSFNTKITPSKTFAKSNLLFKDQDMYNELWYHNKIKNKTIAVVRRSNSFYMITTLFAYNFLVYFIIISLYILGNIIARSNLNSKRILNLLSLNLRLRIQASILLIMLLTFLVIGVFTSKYMSDRVKEKSIIEISNNSQIIENEIANSFHSLPKIDSNTHLQNAINIQTIHIVKQLSKRFLLNINLFSHTNGKLIYSTQPQLYKSGVYSNLLDYTILYKLKYENIDRLINQESIGDFKYIALYSCLKNSDGETFAILQLPYPYSNLIITSETNSIIVTIINIYVFVFLLSSILAYFISNSVSKPFKRIVKQFTQINLAKTNEPLKWNSADEIGMLVKEYNRMLRKLENSTVQLAKNERETAWREMAKQVAHEIKNPLTPMKLSMQMLERAIKNKKEGITEMTLRVSKTIIEQIDNLSVIATNFSNFAKMPEPQKEAIELNEILYSVTGMYFDDSEFEFLFIIPDYIIKIYADKNQLIRVLTNIIQNAIQAIPETQKGHITLIVSKLKDNFIRISISDDGKGISPEKVSEIFKPYYTTKASGTGLGLPMCKDILELIGGRITFDSVLNQGTTFHIDLPILSEDEA